ncbi:hypothetical protein CRG98_012674 [Punica granatum]|uniref:Retrotransposon gag domain-containing protein n=1 Tax=Punica granatum TaxID=22663 RepID=A0A2I0KEH2_PUNGR|nr:hypothetical protein CRG98_012674 [Punica granatum]
MGSRPQRGLRVAPYREVILRAKVPRKFTPPQITLYDGKMNSINHVRRYTASLLVREVSKQAQRLMFPRILTGDAADWLHSLQPGSIGSFKQLKELFLERFESMCQAKRSVTKLFSLEQREKESLRDWYDRFFKASTEVEDLI